MPEGFQTDKQTNNKEKASRKTHARNNKINEGKQHKNKTQMETCSGGGNVKKGHKKKQRSRILQTHENKTILHT
jgi:hypothetical protein